MVDASTRPLAFVPYVNLARHERAALLMHLKRILLSRPGCVLIALFAITAIGTQVAIGQSSMLPLVPGANNWLTSPAWSAGVPNSPGAEAQLRMSSGQVSQVAIGSPVTVEQLLIQGFGSTTLQGAGPLVFQSDGSGELLLQLSAMGGAANATVAAPLQWSASDALRLDVGTQSVLNVNGLIAAGNGGLVKTGAGELRVGGANGAWSGGLDVVGGRLVVTHAQGLGAASAGTTVRSDGRLVLQHSTAEPFFLDGGVLQLPNIDLSGPMAISGSALLHRPQNPITVISNQPFESTLGPTNVNSIITGGGDLTIRNESRDPLYLRGANSYSGRTYAAAGNVIVTSATALGDATEGTTINGATLNIQAATAERFRIESGALLFNAGDFIPASPIIVAGGDVRFPVRSVVDTPIVVDGLSGAIYGAGSSSSFVGGSTGVGNLRVARFDVDTPLMHQGALTLDEANLNVANSYTGDTIVVGYTSEVNHAGALGASENVRIEGGQLQLNVIPSRNPSYFIKSGGLFVADSSQPFRSPIIMGNGASDATLGGGVFEGPITLLTGFNNRITGGTFNGSIAGPGAVGLSSGDAPLHLNAANAIGGPVQIRGGQVHMNHPQALDLNNTSVTRGTLHINAPANGHVLTNEDFSAAGHVVFGVAQEIEDPWVLNAGKLTVAAPTGMNRLITIGGTDTSHVDGGPLRIDGELTNIYRANVNAAIAGAGDIRNIGHQLGVYGDLSNFAGKLVAERGETYINELAANSLDQGEIHIYDGGALRFNTSNDTDFVVDADVFLHNANGDGQLSDAALIHDYYASEARFRGRIDVGVEGSTTQGNFSVEGELTGSNLTHRGGSLALRSPQTQLIGELRLDGSALDLAENGRIAGVEAIVMQKGAVISMSQTSLSGPQDRLDDAVPIRSRGGYVYLYSTNQQPGVETLGTLSLERGVTQLMANSDHGTPTASLTINQIERDAGAILHFRQGWWRRGLKLANPQLTHGMLGGWAVTETGFATVDGNLVETLIANKTNFAGAGAADHVNVTSPQVLSSDATIASLRSERTDTPIDLGGHRLTVESGGVFRAPDVGNGVLTTGTSVEASELMLHEAEGLISADIQDNGAGGSVALVINEGNPRISGVNTYTGGTWITGVTDAGYDRLGGTLRIQGYSAIPANDRVYVDNGVYNLEALPAGVVHLAELHLREGGRISSYFAQIDADTLVLEEGLIYATLVGDGDAIKQTDGVVDFSNSKSPHYTGVMTVQDGRVLVQPDTLPQAQFHLKGGELRFSSSGNIPNHFILDGGAVDGGLSGLIDVQSDSVLMHQSSTRISGTLRGSGDLSIRGRQDSRFSASVGLFGDGSQYSGDFQIESGALRIGAPGSAGSGDVNVHAAGRLILQTNSYTNPPLEVNNDVHLYGGTLYSFPPSDGFGGSARSPSILHGDVTVHGEGYIGALQTGLKNGVTLPGLTLAGDVILQDGVHVYGLSDGRHTIASGDVALVDVAGRMLVGADATWHLLSSSLSISGEIRANAPAAAIDFVGGRDQLRLKGAKLHADVGQSLSVTVNGGSLPMSIAGSGNVLSGDGVLAGDFTITNGASVAPGASPGVLTLDGEVVFGPGGKLEIELAGPQLGSQYDQLNVLGHVDLDGAVLDLSFLDGFSPGPNDSFVVLRGASLSGTFVNADSSIQIGGLTLPVTYRPDRVIVGAAVPEPESAMLLLLAGVGLLNRIRHDRKMMSC